MYVSFEYNFNDVNMNFNNETFGWLILQQSRIESDGSDSGVSTTTVDTQRVLSAASKPIGIQPALSSGSISQMGRRGRMMGKSSTESGLSLKNSFKNCNSNHST